jgi:dehydrogenase/reductase SDR family protein 7B
MSSIFNDQVVWITGASSGIGEAMAKDFVARGAKVILTARRADRLQQVADALNVISAGSAKILPADLSNLEVLPELTARALKCFGHIDVLLNNAGVSQRSQVIDTPFAIEHLMIKLDLLSPIALTKAILPHFLVRKSGRILVTSSLMGDLEVPGSATYSCVKHGLNGYFYSMAFEVAALGILVQVIQPGFVKTEVSEKSFTSDGSLYGKMDSTQARAMSAEQFSKRVFPKIERGDTSIYISGPEGYAIYLKRFSPPLYRLIISKFAKKLLKDRLSHSPVQTK